MFKRLYIHVPFCVAKCHYCAFVSNRAGLNELDEYSQLLTRELQLNVLAAEPLASVYFGGGTPSLLQPQQLGQVLDSIAAQMDILAEAEITLEVNPGTVDYESLRAFRAIGINRISLGVQSFEDSSLKCLGRIHTVAQSRQAFYDARKAGFTNISIDLMHSLPNQSIAQWRSELEFVLEVCPEHVSIYGLTVEEGTRFGQLYTADSPELADEDLAADMFELAEELLVAAGFEHYEIANYARAGCRSQHNSGYWQRDGYLGLGVAAHSFLHVGHGVRFSNPATLQDYRQGVMSGMLRRIDEQCLTQEEAMAEYMFLGLRLSEGVNLSAFEGKFGLALESVYGPIIDDLIRLGLLLYNESKLILTLRGMLLSNRVFARFLP